MEYDGGTDVARGCYNSALSRKQRKAVVALLLEPSQTAAAKAAGVGRRTLIRWLQEDADFQKAVRAAESDAIDHAVRCLVQLTDHAVQVLRDVLTDSALSPAVRLRAAGLVLEQVVKLRELRDLESRLSKLEEAWAVAQPMRTLTP